MNPQDWLLQQWLEVWAVKYHLPYDIFEIPPALSVEERTQIENELIKYEYVIATEPWDNAWIIGNNTPGAMVKPDDAITYQNQFENEIKGKGWIKQ
jgi:hypothetical protein